MAEPLALQRRVARSYGGVFAEDEIAIEFAIRHSYNRIHVRMVAGERGQVIVTPVVLFGRCFAEVRLQERDSVFIELSPPAGRRLIQSDPGAEVLIVCG